MIINDIRQRLLHNVIHRIVVGKIRVEAVGDESLLHLGAIEQYPFGLSRAIVTNKNHVFIFCKNTKVYKVGMF